MKRLLVANRGEIAVRIIRAARELGIESVALYTPADAGSLAVRLADKSINLGENQAKASYLNIDKIVNAAIQMGADAVHPGYGFLAENADFAKAVVGAGLVFVGPTAESIAIMGEKVAARQRVSEWDVPVVPGAPRGADVEAMIKFADKVGYPVLLKAAFGGSGRGMRIVWERSELKPRFEEASREALAAFGRGEVFLEKYIEKPRHIEVQVFGDTHGNIIHLGERECSLQRRHQKLVEEALAPHLNQKLRDKIRETACKAAASVNYVGAGTVEFIVQGGDKATDPFYFLEMNTRIQVEHPVTEEVTGQDLVKLQLQVARGQALGLKQEAVTYSGHSIQFRIYAERPDAEFAPMTGTVLYVSRPFGLGVREDSWVEAGTVIPPFYDSLLAKLIITGRTREEAISRARSVLAEYVIEGVDTTLGFHRWLLTQDDYLNGLVDTNWIERNYQGQLHPAKFVGPLVLPQPPQHREQGNA